MIQFQNCTSRLAAHTRTLNALATLVALATALIGPSSASAQSCYQNCQQSSCNGYQWEVKNTCSSYPASAIRAETYGTGSTSVAVEAHSSNGDGVAGYASNGNGVYGWSGYWGASGVYGESGGSGYGVAGRTTSSGTAVLGDNYSNYGYAGYFTGRVRVDGYLSKGGGGFEIDHPVDPASKILVHSFVESPDMKNVYDGIVSLSDSGDAVVQLPSYFEVLNTNFRYQLTPIGAYAPLYISSEVANGKFKIAGGSPRLKVSWQVTGTRQDLWAQKYGRQPEENKSVAQVGYYLNPELFGQPERQRLGFFGKDRLQPSAPRLQTAP